MGIQRKIFNVLGSKDLQISSMGFELSVAMSLGWAGVFGKRVPRRAFVIELAQLLSHKTSIQISK